MVHWAVVFFQKVSRVFANKIKDIFFHSHSTLRNSCIQAEFNQLEVNTTGLGALFEQQKSFGPINMRSQVQTPTMPQVSGSEVLMAFPFATLSQCL